MPVKLDLSNTCVIKELELAHENLVVNAPRRLSPENRMAVDGLGNLIRGLGIRVRCVCHDTRCQFWEGWICSCRGSFMCRDIGFELRAPHLIGEHNPDEPTESEMAMVKSRMTEDETKRQPNELLIVWKFRVAAEIYMRAKGAHNQPEDGRIEYDYSTWREETSEQRINNFERTVAKVRGLASPRQPQYNTAVGCLACGRIYRSEETLNAHVDHMRFTGDNDHLIGAYMISASEATLVRPTPPDYQPPLPPRQPERNPERLDNFEREEAWTDDEWADYLHDALRDYRPQFPNPVACFNDGDVYATENDYMEHCIRAHPDQSTYDARVNIVR